MKRELLRRIKIAHPTAALHVGGKENGMVNLVNAMSTDIFENYIFVFKRGGALRQRIDPGQCQVIELGTRQGGDLRIYLRLAHHFRRLRFNIVHTRSWSSLLEGMIAAKLTGVPLLVHGEHGLIKDDTRIHVWVQRGFWRLADQVMCVSEALRESLVARIGFPRERIRVIKNGVELERFNVKVDRHELKAALGIPPQAPVFGSIGRLVPVKDYATLIKAAKVVLSELSSAHLIFVGDGPLREELRALAERLGIAAQVHFLNWRKDVPALMRVLDVFVLSSLSEGMSNSILEAMCSGTAVVATNVGGNPELVVDKETGLLVPSQDAQQMGRAILALLLDAKRRRAMGAAGRRRIAEHFSLQVMVRNYEKMYLDIASRHYDFHRELQDKIDRRFSPQSVLASASYVE
ncbi:MAG: GT4 family glycosyltransferase PelF [candidate division KSB1 bacterium]|nr:GT4 family glycosyltransferase PelF [candidate division KSB1 bacterium]MDZ7272766.1 GT4 family glycosyltransferase PelF [candidate division KSB1 bacterium]MDZ7284210.1 GT4 family glycosyltransferase PelF [candidate division KSB1 bacterium]MDZ7297392.1 GT4 family glycosyltransferase PelF [candidate division KSB1 bacterium]MDZ7306548.1 GT4 family glycosyltransferase PelF [candidate division KSB1 bacterium]